MRNRVDRIRPWKIGIWLACLVSLPVGGRPGTAYCLTPDELVTIGVYERVASSVVNITTASCDPEFFFCSVPAEAGSASGIILMEDGTIVTNHHVVANAESIQVVLSDGSRKQATLVASSPENDMAIIRIDAAGAHLKPMVLGDSDQVRVGEKVLAIGNPFGLGQTLSVGVVSMTDRSIRNGGMVLENLIQISAAVNPGNSGGALVNSEGQLVGMNTVILSPTGSNVGIGFAIPVNSIKRIAPGLVNAWGRWLGWMIAAALTTWILRRIYRSS